MLFKVTGIVENHAFGFAVEQPHATAHDLLQQADRFSGAQDGNVADVWGVKSGGERAYTYQILELPRVEVLDRFFALSLRRLTRNHPGVVWVQACHDFLRMLARCGK